MPHAACRMPHAFLRIGRSTGFGKEPPPIESDALLRFGVAIDSYLFCFHCFLFLPFSSRFSRYLIIRRCMLQVKTNIWVNGPNNNSNSNPHQPSTSTTTSDNLINNLYCIICCFSICCAATCFHFFHLARTATTQCALAKTRTMYTRMLCDALQCRQRATDGATIMRTQLCVFRGFNLIISTCEQAFKA